MTTFTQIFESVNDCARFIDRETKNTKSSREVKSESFEPNGWKKSLDHFKNGWPEGSKRVANRIASVKAVHDEGDTIRAGYGVKWDVQGDCIDMGRYMSGKPDAFMELTTNYQGKKDLSILIDTGLNAYVSAKDVEIKGATLLVAINELSKHYNLKLYFGRYTEGVSRYGNHNLLSCLKVDTTNNYSVDLIAFLTGHPGYHRRVGFAIAENTLADNDLLIDYNMGRSENIGIDQAKQIDSEIKIIIPKNESDNYSTVEKAIVLISEAIKAGGIDIQL